MYSGRIVEDTPNNRLIDKAWGENEKYIYNWFTEKENISDLRFIIRDGQRILQAKYLVHVEFSEPIIKYDNERIESETKRMWLDVPLEEE